MTASHQQLYSAMTEPTTATAPPRADNWAEDHRRKGTPLKKNTRQTADEARAQPNEAFCRYYRSQLGPLLAEDEWDSMEACMRTALPVTFRLSGPPDDAGAHALRDDMEARLVAPLRSQESVALQPPQPLPWYPQRLGWQFDLSRATLRGKSDGGRSAELRRFHAWLLQEAELGRVQRQEAVSMVPPLLLDVRPGHEVLDMCSSPGSKTQQIIELLHAGDGLESERVSDGRGWVLANDADNKRCHLLVSRAGRLRSPRLVVCNHDARLLPEQIGSGGGGGDTDEALAAEAQTVAASAAAATAALQFDRVLADVPCSGDGTIRKMPAIWRRWSVGSGNALHSLQLQIACKGVRLLRVGGRLVYSTCSLNPIENEAVVAALLRTFGAETLRLVDVSSELPLLRRRKGLRSWRVWYHAAWHESWPEMEARFPRKCPPFESLFPPSEAEAEAMQLERCVRLLPQDNDGGGFFVAVLEKLQPHAAEAGALPDDEPECIVTEGSTMLPEQLTAKAKPAAATATATAAIAGTATATAAIEVEAEAAPAATGRTEEGARAPTAADGEAAEATAEKAEAAEAEKAEAEAEAAGSAAAVQVLHAVGGATVGNAAAAAAANKFAPLYVPQGGLLRELVAFYGLDDAFPLRRLVARSQGDTSALVLVADEVLAVLRRDGGGAGAVRLISTGVRLFGHDGAKGVACAHRLTQIGLPLLLPHMRRQRATLPAATLAALLRAPERAGLPADEWAASCGADGAEQLRASCAAGSVALVCRSAEVPDGRPLALVALFAPSGALKLMVSKAERAATLVRLGGGAEGDAGDVAAEMLDAGDE